MIPFFEWAFGLDRPFWIIAIAAFLLVSLVILALILTLWAIFSGYWIVPVVIFILLPLYVLVKAYLKDTQA